MKVLILAGGYGTRLGEETGVRPKPMVEIGGRPILWHIMKGYYSHGYGDFVVLCGYKGHKIKEYFSNYFLNESSVTFDLANNKMEVVRSDVERWKVTLLNTGIDTLTGGRIKQARKLVNEPFMLTYGDGVSDVPVNDLVKSHKKSGKLVTMTAVRPQGRFGTLEFNQKGEISAFREKAEGERGWINGGFFVCQPRVFDYLQDGRCVFEREPLEQLAREGQINCYRHRGFWKCMDTLADKEALEKLWREGAGWKNW